MQGMQRMQRMKIIKTRLAEQDLIDIWLYSFSEWGELHADHYLDQLNTGIYLLINNPQLGQSFDFNNKDYRYLHIKQHLVFYRLAKDEIQLIRVLHDSMNVDNHL